MRIWVLVWLVQRPDESRSAKMSAAIVFLFWRIDRALAELQ